MTFVRCMHSFFCSSFVVIYHIPYTIPLLHAWWTFASTVLSNATNDDVNTQNLLSLHFCVTTCCCIHRVCVCVVHAKIKYDRKTSKHTTMHAREKAMKISLRQLLLLYVNYRNWVTCQQITWISLDFYGTWTAAFPPYIPIQHTKLNASLFFHISMTTTHTHRSAQRVRFQIWQLIHFLLSHLSMCLCIVHQ